jgi:hypothetical protein
MTMCYFVFQINIIAFIKLKTTNGDVIWATFRPMWEQHLQIPVEEQYVKLIFINASNLPFMALYPIDLEKTIESYQTDHYIVNTYDDGMVENKIDTINDMFAATNAKSV